MMVVIGLGGILGAITRYYLGRFIMERSRGVFPLGTWVINITGSFLLGMLTFLHLQQYIPEWIWLSVGIGYLGSYTTFSTFGYETIQLIEKKNTLKAISYVLTTVIFGVLSAWLGMMLGHLV